MLQVRRVAGRSCAALALVIAALFAAPAQAESWPLYLGHWQTASKPAYQDTFYIELQVVRLQTGYSMTWVQHFAAHPPRELRYARLIDDTENRWRYTATEATGRTREGAAWFGPDGLRIEYREQDPSGRSARILETFTRGRSQRLESTRLIWRAGGWQPLTTESWWRVGDN